MINVCHPMPPRVLKILINVARRLPDIHELEVKGVQNLTPEESDRCGHRPEQQERCKTVN